jgi:hypothetical protein
MGWMVGSPPPPDKLIQFADGSHLRFPQLRWSVANFRRFMPSANVWRGDGPVSPLPRALRADIKARHEAMLAAEKEGKRRAKK